MYYLKLFEEILGLGEWAPLFFGASSATPWGVYGVIRLWRMGSWGDRNPVDTRLSRLCIVSGSHELTD